MTYINTTVDLFTVISNDVRTSDYRELVIYRNHRLPQWPQCVGWLYYNITISQTIYLATHTLSLQCKIPTIPAINPHVPSRAAPPYLPQPPSSHRLPTSPSNFHLYILVLDRFPTLLTSWKLVYNTPRTRYGYILAKTGLSFAPLKNG